MISILSLIFIIIGVLIIFVYPKLINLAVLLVITYFVIFVKPIYAIAYIPVLLLMLYYKRQKEKYRYE